MACKVSYSSPVRATRATLWSVLVDKAENPGRYVPGFIEAEVLERDAAGVLCRLRTDRFDIVERIRIDAATHTVCYELIDHPDYAGILINRMKRTCRLIIARC